VRVDWQQHDGRRLYYNPDGSRPENEWIVTYFECAKGPVWDGRVLKW
jgi:hypothetical protein